MARRRLPYTGSVPAVPASGQEAVSDFESGHLERRMACRRVRACGCGGRADLHTLALVASRRWPADGSHTLAVYPRSRLVGKKPCPILSLAIWRGAWHAVGSGRAAAAAALICTRSHWSPAGGGPQTAPIHWQCTRGPGWGAT